MAPAEKTDAACLAERLLTEPGSAETLSALRDFRNRVLSGTPQGSAIIARYNRLGPEIARVLHRRPLLKKRCRKLLDELLPEIKAALAGKRALPSSHRLNTLSRLLFDLEKASPAPLQKELRELRRWMKQTMDLPSHKATARQAMGRGP